MHTLYSGVGGYNRDVREGPSDYIVQDGINVDQGSEPKRNRRAESQEPRRGDFYEEAPEFRGGGQDPRVDTTTITIRKKASA